ncbi:MAG TPA: hypothetical protein DC054_25725 [Blastocatellia bacterium]|nr:hypothetical protein [Blastocatellia bacterium]
MTNHKTMKRFVMASAICLVAAACLAISGKGSGSLQQPAAQQPSNDDIIALRQAIRQGGLRAAAKLKGHYVAEYNPHWDWGQFSFETLNKNSAAVVVGRFTKKLDPRLLEGLAIYTDYEFTVDELVKGDIKQTEPIVVTLPGGRIDFEDGTSAELTTPSFEHPLIGRAYTLFLMREAALPSVFFLAGGPQGMFDIEDSAAVRSRGLPQQPTVIETKGKNRESFLKDVRELARKWPKPGKCC